MSLAIETNLGQDFEPPQEITVALEDGRVIAFTPYESRMIDVTDLPPPLLTELTTFDASLTDEEQQEQIEYMRVSEQRKWSVWNEIDTFILQANDQRPIASDRDATHLTFNEYLQNAFRHGECPLHVWVGIVEARISDLPDSLGFRVLLGVQDLNPKWGESDTTNGLLNHLRGQSLIDYLSVATWHQADERQTSKWVWALI